MMHFSSSAAVARAGRKSVSDSGQLLQQIVDEDVLDPFEDVSDGGKHPREDRLGDETHRLGKLVRQQGQ